MDIPRLQKTLEAAGFTVQWFPTAQAAKEALVARFAGLIYTSFIIAPE